MHVTARWVQRCPTPACATCPKPLAARLASLHPLPPAPAPSRRSSCLRVPGSVLQLTDAVRAHAPWPRAVLAGGGCGVLPGVVGRSRMQRAVRARGWGFRQAGSTWLLRGSSFRWLILRWRFISSPQAGQTGMHGTTASLHTPALRQRHSPQHGRRGWRWGAAGSCSRAGSGAPGRLGAQAVGRLPRGAARSAALQPARLAARLWAAGRRIMGSPPWPGLAAPPAAAPRCVGRSWPRKVSTGSP